MHDHLQHPHHHHVAHQAAGVTRHGVPRHVGLLDDAPVEDLNLWAGQLYFGTRVRRVRTLLGSCVGVTLWCAQRQIGGMCHFLLPSCTRTEGEPLDGRFGDKAMRILLLSLQRAGTRPQDYQAHLYGGADTMPERVGVKFNAGERNIEKGWSLIDELGFELVNVDVGDHVPRNVSLNMSNGDVDMRRGAPIRRG
jgi:chemotaxis protein CheD